MADHLWEQVHSGLYPKDWCYHQNLNWSTVRAKNRIQYFWHNEYGQSKLVVCFSNFSYPRVQSYNRWNRMRKDVNQENEYNWHSRRVHCEWVESIAVYEHQTLTAICFRWQHKERLRPDWKPNQKFRHEMVRMKDNQVMMMMMKENVTMLSVDCQVRIRRCHPSKKTLLIRLWAELDFQSRTWIPCATWPYRTSFDTSNFGDRSMQIGESLQFHCAIANVSKSGCHTALWAFCWYQMISKWLVWFGVHWVGLSRLEVIKFGKLIKSTSIYTVYYTVRYSIRVYHCATMTNNNNNEKVVGKEVSTNQSINQRACVLACVCVCVNHSVIIKL